MPHPHLTAQLPPLDSTGDSLLGEDPLNPQLNQGPPLLPEALTVPARSLYALAIYFLTPSPDIGPPKQGYVGLIKGSSEHLGVSSASLGPQRAGE